MFKITGPLILSLILSLPLAAAAIEAGDPDSDSAPARSPAAAGYGNVDNEDDNPDAHADDANNVKSTTPPPVLPAEVGEQKDLPGAHLVAGETETLPSDEDKWHEMPFARLQGLNKVTARSTEIKADIGKSTKFGNLEVTVNKCLRGPENEKQENTVQLSISDVTPGSEKKEIFKGWMFSSSPAISALEHPIYDIILLGCGEAPKPVVVETVDPKKAAKKSGKKTKEEQLPE